MATAPIVLLYELKSFLSKEDFATVEAFILLNNEFKPEEAGQIGVCFQLFVENLESRYHIKFDHYYPILFMQLDAIECDTIENERSPDSERRRNKGKMYRDSGDGDNRVMCDRSAAQRHIEEMAKVAKLEDSVQRNASRDKEIARHKQYTAGKNSTSPIKQVETE